MSKYYYVHIKTTADTHCNKSITPDSNYLRIKSCTLNIGLLEQEVNSDIVWTNTQLGISAFYKHECDTEGEYKIQLKDENSNALFLSESAAIYLVQQMFNNDETVMKYSSLRTEITYPNYFIREYSKEGDVISFKVINKENAIVKPVYIVKKYTYGASGYFLKYNTEFYRYKVECYADGNTCIEDYYDGATLEDTLDSEITLLDNERLLSLYNNKYHTKGYFVKYTGVKEEILPGQIFYTEEEAKNALPAYTDKPISMVKEIVENGKVTETEIVGGSHIVSSGVWALVEVRDIENGSLTDSRRIIKYFENESLLMEYQGKFYYRTNGNLVKMSGYEYAFQNIIQIAPQCYQRYESARDYLCPFTIDMSSVFPDKFDFIYGYEESKGFLASYVHTSYDDIYGLNRPGAVTFSIANLGSCFSFVNNVLSYDGTELDSSEESSSDSSGEEGRSYFYVVTATCDGKTATKTIQVNINDLVITFNDKEIELVRNESFSYNLSRFVGLNTTLNLSLTYSLANDTSLPDGFALNSSTGVISGLTSVLEGTYTTDVKVTAPNGEFKIATITFVVSARLNIIETENSAYQYIIDTPVPQKVFTIPFTVTDEIDPVSVVLSYNGSEVSNNEDDYVKAEIDNQRNRLTITCKAQSNPVERNYSMRLTSEYSSGKIISLYIKYVNFVFDVKRVDVYRDSTSKKVVVTKYPVSSMGYTYGGSTSQRFMIETNLNGIIEPTYSFEIISKSNSISCCSAYMQYRNASYGEKLGTYYSSYNKESLYSSYGTFQNQETVLLRVGHGSCSNVALSGTITLRVTRKDTGQYIDKVINISQSRRSEPKPTPPPTPPTKCSYTELDWQTKKEKIVYYNC